MDSPKNKALKKKTEAPEKRVSNRLKRKELNAYAKKVGGSSARYIGKRGPFTGL